mmetsp:Transcript_33530/g.75234  ORF Transcript_33530/g.75234 Transcript_33530/m.75234 type:complete len:220 (+) Transcript_33530:263-922(+)
MRADFPALYIHAGRRFDRRSCRCFPGCGPSQLRCWFGLREGMLLDVLQLQLQLLFCRHGPAEFRVLPLLALLLPHLFLLGNELFQLVLAFPGDGGGLIRLFLLLPAVHLRLLSPLEHGTYLVHVRLGRDELCGAVIITLWQGSRSWHPQAFFLAFWLLTCQRGLLGCGGKSCAGCFLLTLHLLLSQDALGYLGIRRRFPFSRSGLLLLHRRCQALNRPT